MISFTAEQCILVTGASSGIGEAIALQCNALGATVIASGRNRERLEVNKIRATCPERFHAEPRELMEDMEALPAWIKSLREKYGKLSGLVPCAGITLTAPLREYDLNTAHRMFDLLFHVPMLLTKGFVDRRNNVGKGAAVVFIAAAGAITPTASLLIYSAAKGALLTASRNISKELAPAGLRVNSISPALVATPMAEQYAGLLGAGALAELEQTYPLGLGAPDDVAGAATYLLSSASRWITGQNLLMTGGFE